MIVILSAITNLDILSSYPASIEEDSEDDFILNSQIASSTFMHLDLFHPTTTKFPRLDDQMKRVVSAVQKQNERRKSFYLNNSTSALNSSNSAVTGAISNAPSSFSPGTDQQCLIRSIVAVPRDELQMLQKNFGKFQLFNGALPGGAHLSAELFLDTVRKFVWKNFPTTDPIAILPHFYSILDASLFGWFFKLPSETTKDWQKFADSFVSEVDSVELEYRKLCHLNQKDFVSWMTQKNKNNIKLIEKFQKKPTLTYFTQKLKILKRVYCDLSDETAVSMSLSLLTDKNRIKKYRRIADFDALLFSMSMDDDASDLD